MSEKVLSKSMKKYESLLKIICNTETLEFLNKSEWEGCLGGACVMAVMEGARPTLTEIARHLDISVSDESLGIAFDRLRVNGVFGAKYDVKNDKALKGRAKETKMRTSSEIHMGAWCNIVGIAGGMAGLCSYKTW